MVLGSSIFIYMIQYVQKNLIYINIQNICKKKLSFQRIPENRGRKKIHLVGFTHHYQSIYGSILYSSYHSTINKVIFQISFITKKVDRVILYTFLKTSPKWIAGKETGTGFELRS